MPIPILALTAAATSIYQAIKRIYKWQKKALAPVAAARGAEPDPATAAELRQLRALARRQAQAVKILKKASASKRLMRIISVTETP